MKLKGLTYLLLLLLPVPALDDLWACATPDPADDVQAAENNDYLTVARARPTDDQRQPSLPPTAAPLSDDRAAAVIAAAPPAHSRTSSGPALLYVLKSLRW